jgi:hypothetical protein
MAIMDMFASCASKMDENVKFQNIKVVQYQSPCSSNTHRLVKKVIITQDNIKELWLESHGTPLYCYIYIVGNEIVFVVFKENSFKPDIHLL